MSITQSRETNRFSLWMPHSWTRMRRVEESRTHQHLIRPGGLLDTSAWPFSCCQEPSGRALLRLRHETRRRLRFEIRGRQSVDAIGVVDTRKWLLPLAQQLRNQPARLQ